MPTSSKNELRKHLDDIGEQGVEQTLDNAKPSFTDEEVTQLLNEADPALNHQADTRLSGLNWADRTMDLTERVSGKVGMAAFVLPMGLGLGGWAAGKAGYTHTAQQIGAVQGATIEQLGPVGRAIEGITGVFTGGIAKVTDGLHSLGVTDVFSGRYASKAEKITNKIGSHAKYVTGVTTSHAGLNEHLTALKTMLSEPAAHLDVEAFTKHMGETKTLAKQHAPGLVDSLKKLEKNIPKLHNAEYMADGWKNLSQHTREFSGKVGKASAMNSLMNASFIVGAGTSDFFTLSSAITKLHDLKEMYADMMGKKPEQVSVTDVLFSSSAPDAVKHARLDTLKEFAPSVILDAANTVLNVKFVLKPPHSMLGWLPLMILPMASQMVRSMVAGKLLPAFHVIKESHEQGQNAPAIAYAELLAEGCPELKKRGGIKSHFTLALAEKYSKDQLPAAEVLHRIADKEVEKEVDALQQEYVEHQKTMAAPAAAQAQSQSPIQSQSAIAQANEVPDTHVSHVQKISPASPVSMSAQRQQTTMIPAVAQRNPQDIDVVGKYTKQLAKDRAENTQLSVS